jgi:hypothetical protein
MSKVKRFRAGKKKWKKQGSINPEIIRVIEKEIEIIRIKKYSSCLILNDQNLPLPVEK